MKRASAIAALLSLLPGLLLAAPATGPERRAILDALRALGDLPARVFVVRILRVSGAWAWVQVNPRSRDGTQRYEPESALLHRGARGWAVVDQPCSEESCDAARELVRIRHAHPSAPASLFRPSGG